MSLIDPESVFAESKYNSRCQEGVQWMNGKSKLMQQ